MYYSRCLVFRSGTLAARWIWTAAFKQTLSILSMSGTCCFLEGNCGTVVVAMLMTEKSTAISGQVCLVGARGHFPGLPQLSCPITIVIPGPGHTFEAPPAPALGGQSRATARQQAIDCYVHSKTQLLKLHHLPVAPEVLILQRTEGPLRTLPVNADSPSPPFVFFLLHFLRLCSL